jgi:hypothetical protein
MVESSPKVLTCVRHRGRKDGIMRLYWQIDFQTSVTQQGDKCLVKDDSSLKETLRIMKRLAPALGMFNEWYESEVPIEGEIASIVFIPDDTQSGQGLSRIVQALKDSYRTLHPNQWKVRKVGVI